jgi:16S rRNA (guanine527-N7)-methyltransferase
MLHVEHWSEPDLPAALTAIAPRGTLDKLVDLSALVRKWNPKINLIAKSTEGDLWHRHMIDSLQILSHGEQSVRWCDIGAGGGFPGLVVAIARPETEVILIESDQRKCAFLTVAKQQLALTNLTVRAERIEDSAPANADTVSARALAALDKLLPLVNRHMVQDGRAVLMKGESAAQEINAARQHWDFQAERQPSITDRNATILVLRNLKRL